jgi:hypothetical protein
MDLKLLWWRCCQQPTLVGLDWLGSVIQQEPGIVKTIVTEQEQVSWIIAILTNHQKFRRDTGGAEQWHDVRPFR